jgi:hypothetical protein
MGTTTVPFFTATGNADHRFAVMDLDGANAALARFFRRDGDVMTARRKAAQDLIGLEHALEFGDGLGSPPSAVSG